MAVFCNDDAPPTENVVQRSVKFTKTDGRNSSTQSCYFWKTINYNPCFSCFYGFDFLFLDIPTTADVPRFRKNSKAHAKRCTLKQFLECSWYYTMSCLTSIDAKYFFFKYQHWWLLLRKLLKIIQYISNSMKSLS